ncbi:MAG: formylglycine-generating enzyme family protein [Pseudomonadota bacterium]|nr:formylglycine-generating enzyme family protein [Pseudomonadota bacterium]
MARVGLKFIFYVGLLLLVCARPGSGFTSGGNDEKFNLKVGLLLGDENLMVQEVLGEVYEDGCRRALGVLFSEVVNVNNLEELNQLPLYLRPFYNYMPIISQAKPLDSDGQQSYERALVFTLYVGKRKLWSNAETVKKVSPLFAFSDRRRRAEIEAFHDAVERMTGALLDDHCLRDDLSILSADLVEIGKLRVQAEADEEVGDYPSALRKYSEIMRIDGDCDWALGAARQIELEYYVNSIDRALEQGELAIVAKRLDELREVRQISGYAANVRVPSLEGLLKEISLVFNGEEYFVPLESSFSEELVAYEQESVIVSELAEGDEIDESSLSGVWVEPETGMEFIYVAGGSFAMGSSIAETGHFDDEEPQHGVQVDGFWLGRYEVTNEQYRHFKMDHDSGYYKDRSLNDPRQPVAGVSWREAVAFANWLSAQGNGKFRLPSEAEWEYACRGGTLGPWFWGDDAVGSCAYANLADQTARLEWPDWPGCECVDGYVENAPVGSFTANNFGLYDMLGNVWEWCGDRYGENYYDRSPGENPTGPSIGYLRVMRGGSWDVTAKIARSALRRPGKPDYRYLGLGLRLLRVE